MMLDMTNYLYVAVSIGVGDSQLIIARVFLLAELWRTGAGFITFIIDLQLQILRFYFRSKS